MSEDFDVHFLAEIKGEVLDRYLANGWYRMGLYIFTTHSLQPSGDENSYPVYWLRYDVRKVKLGKSNRVLAKACSTFMATVRPFSLTQELADLHKTYFDHLDFHASDSIENLLTDINRVIYDTYLVEVRDNGKLIAAGIFDKGSDAIAGIINFYDPVYKKYGLGKYLVLLKYTYCLRQGITWYYPGYFSPTYPKFDYKLFLDKNATEVFVRHPGEWIGYHDFIEVHINKP